MARRKRALSEHEEKTIRAFVLEERQERELLKLARGDIESTAWAHRPPLDPAAMWRVPPGWGADQLLEELRRRGAQETAVGVIGQLAGKSVPLDEAVHTVFAVRVGTLLSLIPGRLAYYDGEDARASFVLSR